MIAEFNEQLEFIQFYRKKKKMHIDGISDADANNVRHYTLGDLLGLIDQRKNLIREYDEFLNYYSQYIVEAREAHEDSSTIGHDFYLVAEEDCWLSYNYKHAFKQYTKNTLLQETKCKLK